MEDHEEESPEEKRLQELARMIDAAYVLIGMHLERLDIPILLPIPDDDPGTHAVMILAAYRTMNLLQEHPGPRLVTGGLRLMLADWLTGYEVQAIAQIAGATPWRIAILEMVVQRIGAIGAQVELELPGSEE